MEFFDKFAPGTAMRVKDLHLPLEHTLRNYQPRCHYCQTLDVEVLRSNKDANILKARAHGLVPLGNLLAEFAPSSSEVPLSEMQRAAFEKHQAITATLLAEKFFILDVVRKYYSIFDHLYFFGTIAENVPLKLKRISQNRKGDTSTWGITKQVCICMLGRKVSITLDHFEHITDDDYPVINIKGIFLALLGTLLHEMIHAFFFLHSCTRSRKCRKEAEVGHGAPWHIAALGIEKSAKTFLGLTTHLGRETTLEQEIHASKKKGWRSWPSPQEFQTLEIDPVVFKLIWGPNWIWDTTGLRLKRAPVKSCLSSVESLDENLAGNLGHDESRANGSMSTETAKDQSPSTGCPQTWNTFWRIMDDAEFTDCPQDVHQAP